MTLDSFRKLRQPVGRCLLPMLLFAWLGAAAAPCAAMAVAENPAQSAMGMHHHADGAGETQADSSPPRHPSCPHCTQPASGCMPSELSAHASCRVDATIATQDDRYQSPKPDFSHFILATASAGLDFARAGPRGPGADSLCILPPAPALRLRFCVFLN